MTRKPSTTLQAVLNWNCQQNMLANAIQAEPRDRRGPRRFFRSRRVGRSLPCHWERPCRKFLLLGERSCLYIQTRPESSFCRVAVFVKLFFSQCRVLEQFTIEMSELLWWARERAPAPKCKKATGGGAGPVSPRRAYGHRQPR